MIIEPAPAKVNLALHVRGRRPDGYHNIETMFAFCAHGDTLTVALAKADSFAVSGPFAVALADDNFVLRAARAFTARFIPDARYAITLDKRLPVASGVGGGSADAAATLRALARLHRIDDDAALAEMARGLGADVPACLLGRAAFGSGRGDDLHRLPPLGDMPTLLVNPGVAVSTAAVFARWDGKDRGPLDPADWRSGRNDLEAPARGLASVIGDVLALLAGQAGAVMARMSGSGATCFALFESVGERDAADAAIARARPDWWRLETTLG